MEIRMTGRIRKGLHLDPIACLGFPQTASLYVII
jgi:hypothetical protein